MNAFRKNTMPAKMCPPKKTSILEEALKNASIRVDEDLVRTPPTLLSPLNSPPLTPPPKPSEKLLKFLSLRKKCNLSRTPCSYTYLKGPKKGQKCCKPSGVCEVLCSQHLPRSSVAVASRSTTENLSKLRINRLHVGKKYFFVRVECKLKVILRRGDLHYILNLPRGMVHPERPSKRHYLIRNKEGKTVWMLAPMCFTS